MPKPRSTGLTHGLTGDIPHLPDVLPVAILDNVTPEITRVPIVFVNAYLVEGGDGWVLVDTGVPGSAGYIQQAAAEVFGRDSKPSAIVLTHGHFDHGGSAQALARHWQVPVYAHRLELPYLSGRSGYPPRDPSVGGAIAQMSRLFPDHGYDLGEAVLPLPGDGSVPGLPGWRWLHTPGHTAGHVSLFREEGRVLLAGDAVATMDMDSWVQMVAREPELSGPPAPMTPDWQAALASIDVLAGLEPALVAAGHGKPLTGAGVSAAFRSFSESFRPPRQGRYVNQPAVADETGVISVPPPVRDPIPLRAAGAAAAAAFAMFLLRRRK